KWDLLCKRNYYVELSQIFFQLGCLAGEIFFSYLIDKYGRRMCQIVTHAVIFFLGLAYAMAYNYTTFAVLRVFIGVALNGTAGLMYLIELFDSKHRTIASLMCQIIDVLMLLLLCLLAYVIFNWRSFHSFYFRLVFAKIYS
ncbi:hypothetical protein HELRODRAFT_86279, partial [Helobdella robusta]|uniref:Major facilitator superfamily (MFS) profile domain-containing protein n=1 Tax=Helobdella robusta TaxID=6412 RepID=T1G697_HELRO